MLNAWKHNVLLGEVGESSWDREEAAEELILGLVGSDEPVNC